MLEVLSDLIQNNENKAVESPGSDQNQFDNFYHWDANMELKGTFTNFTREEKFERVFLVLNLLIRIFEDNLAMFLTQYSRKLRTCLEDNTRRPLICSVLWTSHETFPDINYSIKNIITIFVRMIAQGFSTDKVRVIARLINVISQVLNLYEYPDENIDYLSYKSFSINLAEALKNAIHKNAPNSIDLTIATVEKLRSPLLQMLLCHDALKNIQNISKPPSLEVPLELICSKAFAKLPKERTSLSPGKRATPRRVKTTQEQFLKLVAIYMRSINAFYLIKDCYQKHKQIPTTEEKKFVPACSSPTNFTNFKEKVDKVDLEEQIQLRQVTSTAKKQTRIKASKESLIFYRNEMKYFVLLAQRIEHYHTKEGPLFNELMELAKEWDV